MGPPYLQRGQSSGRAAFAAPSRRAALGALVADRLRTDAPVPHNRTRRAVNRLEVSTLFGADSILVAG
jgi:hypothetical protein